MGKRKQALIDSDSSSGSESDLDSELLSLSKKRKAGANNVPKNTKNYSDSDSDWTGHKNGAPGRKKKATKKVHKSSSSEPNSNSEVDEEENQEPPAKKQIPPQPFKENVYKKIRDEEPEEGEVSDTDDDSESQSDSSSSSASEFDDGFDENLMGDEEDRARLNALSEKERETEIFKRIERRDLMRTRWEIERKLKMAKRGEKANQKPKKDKKKKDKKKDKEKKNALAKLFRAEPVKILPKLKSPSPPKLMSAFSILERGEILSEEASSPDRKDSDGTNNEYFDPKERSKERKKNVEANRTDDKRSNAMAMLKAKREGKAKREEEEAKRQAEREREEEKEELEGVTTNSKSADKIKVSDIYSDDSGSSSSSEDEEKNTGSGKQSGDSSQKSSSESDEDDKHEKKSPFIKTKEDLNKLRISRFKMERFINLPIFEKTVMNSFVRISIGNNNQRPVYRAAEVVGVVETAKIYQLGKLRTNRGLKLKHGSQERVFRLEFISNQDFTDSEFEKWREMCEKTNVTLPTVDHIEKKQKDIKFAMNYEYSDEDVHKIIQERNRFRKNPTNYAMKKTCLMKERDAALLQGENELAHELSVKIDELECRANELDKRRSSSINLISYINNRNRKKNVEHAEKAIMEEALANRGQRIEDPFTRRLTQPRMTFNSNAEKKEAEKLPMLPLLPPPPPGGRKKIDEERKRNNVEHNLYSLHDFEIDLDVPLPVNPVSVLPKPISKPLEIAPKRSLNLEDYKKKRGLI